MIMSDQSQGQTTCLIQEQLVRLRQGAPDARNELIAVAARRMREIATRMLQQFVGNVPRGAEPDDVVNQTVIRLCKALENVQPNDAKHFIAIAGWHMRRELLEWVRSGERFEELGSRDVVERSTLNKDRVKEWQIFLTEVEELPSDEQKVFQAKFFMGTTLEEIAREEKTPLITVRRRWSRAQRLLAEKIGSGKGGGPEWDRGLQQ